MLAPWKKSYGQPRQHIKKQKRYFANKGPSSQRYCFSSSHVQTESSPMKKLGTAPWTARRSNQSILKKISPEYSFEGLMLKPKLQSFGHLMRWTDSLVKTMMLGKIEGGRRRGWQRMPTQWKWVWVNSGSWWWTQRPGVLQSMGSQRVGHNWVTGLTEGGDNWASQVVPVVKNLPTNARNLRKGVQTLHWEEPLEESTATHSSILARRIPWTEETGGLRFKDLQRLRHNTTEAT